MQLSKHFMFYSGIDLRVGVRNSAIQILDSQLIVRSLISSKEKSFGFGPFCGFVWQINPRVALLTEANFYANHLYTRRYADDGTTKINLENSEKWVFTPVIPTSIFLSINF